MDWDNTQAADRQLVLAALSNRNAYGAVVQRFEAPLRRYVRRLLGQEAGSADDVLQNVFIKAYMNLNDYDPTRPFGPWLYRIAHNEAISHLRKLKSGPQPLPQADADAILERIADPDDPASLHGRKNATAQLRRALDRLAPKYRDVLTLRYLEEQSYDEISDILRLPPGTVATLLRRGLDRLRQDFELRDEKT